MSLAAPTSCGVTNSGQFTTSRGTAGQYQLSITQNGLPLWDMLVFRPAASSGTLASGIEVRDVKYKGKSVLKRGHAPVLNVRYPGGKCGPYRDWQWQEDMFQTAPDSTDPAPGIRVLPPGQIAQTVVENDNDVGDFKGVAIYTHNGETVLVTEMQAGWYRYMMQWRFADDGTIRPRFGFGSVNSYCVCELHNHNIYWRFDFDIVNPINKVFQVERARKFLQPITTEVTRLKNFQTNRSIMVQNSSGDEAYMLVPNYSDGIADSFARSDFWVLQYKNVPGGTPLENELDDGYYFPDGDCTETDGTCINIDKFINGESLVNKDVVVWYGAHFVHDDAANPLNHTNKASDHSRIAHRRSRYSSYSLVINSPLKLLKIASRKLYFVILDFIKTTKYSFYSFRSAIYFRCSNFNDSEITGFKSFADYTEIVFTGSGITAVVGPNGCGKSNVSDSIAWVLGEQKAKSLRGEEMKDVVFQGTSKRKPSGMAEVVLHLVRDDEMLFETDEEELGDIDETLSEY